jgi:dipeptidyl aminopeptidase/acylaminoacyl peptidase
MSLHAKNCTTLLFLTLCFISSAFSQKRPGTIADSIGASAFGAPLDEALGYPLVIWSPKHDAFAVITHRGVISSNTNRYTLTLFREASRPSEMRPIRLYDMESSSLYPAIDNVRWSDDSSRLIFIGEMPGQPRQVYTFDLHSRKLIQFTHCKTDVLTFAATGNLQRIAFLANPPATAKDLGHEVIVSGQTLVSLLGGEDEPGLLQNFQFFVQQLGGRERKISLGNEYPDVDCGLTISPDGRYATVALLAEDRPPSWVSYHILGRWIVHYDLIATDSGRVSPLLDAPSSNWRQEVAWIGNSHSLVIAGTYLPLNDATLKSLVSVTQQATVEVRIADRHLSLVTNEPLHLIDWNTDANRLILQEDSGQLVAFSKRGDTWQSQGEWSDPRDASASYEVRIEQDMNTPPRLIAIEKSTGKKSVLFDPNPQFSNLEFAAVKEIEWKGTDGRLAHGGIYLPVRYVAGKRYPLVIQTHGWSKNQFWMDGPSTAGYAAQALAGKGFVVAQVDEPDGQWTWATTPQEGPVLSSMIDGLIDELDKEGLIDCTHVGIFGWSRSGYLVRYMLAFSHDTFGAAIMAEGFDDGYFHYLTRLNLGKAEASTYEHMIGTVPFGSGIQDWVQRSSAFHLENVRTPVRILLTAA